MTNKEKMMTGRMYETDTDELYNERMKAKELCRKLGNTSYKNTKKHDQIIKQLFGKTKGKFKVMAPFYCDYGYNIEIGENFYINHGGVILDCAKVTFGDNVFIGPQCGFYGANHPVEYQERNKGIENAKPITIGNNVWIGGGAIILSGVTIGDNTVIGAGSVVTKDIPPNVVAVGNPCKVIREIKQ